MNLETKIIIYKFTPQVFTLTLNPCHALLQTYFSASFVILLLSLQNKVGVK